MAPDLEYLVKTIEQEWPKIFKETNRQKQLQQQQQKQQQNNN